MTMLDIIEKKKRGLPLSDSEIEFAVGGYTDGVIPDYQMSAFLMAVYFNGMDDRELFSFTRCMINSGDVLNLSDISGVKADKHSTGGVGDKTTLIVVPMVASCGLKVAKMSGRGLGNTGGTVDKLESVRGFNTQPSGAEFTEQLKRVGAVLSGQTGKLAPADKKIYALRDATNTVDSIPLIASSVMSKKIASGADVIVLDVKVGRGTFMRSANDAELLADTMISIGESYGKKVSVVMSDMNEPLGFAIGNSLEVSEAVSALSGDAPDDLKELCNVLAAQMLSLGGFGTVSECERLAEDSISSGRALEKFKEIISAQGGDVDYMLNMPKAEFQYELKSVSDGYVGGIFADLCGAAAMKLGAGRVRKEDKIDPLAGVRLSKKRGDRVNAGDTLATLYTSERERLNEAAELMEKAFVIDGAPPKKRNLIIKIK